MKIVETKIEGLLEIWPDIFRDDRGHFLELHNKSVFNEKGIHANFVQDNCSFSHKGVVRGIHLQYPPHQQAKFVRVIRGKVLDIAVDLRPGSPTFGQSHSLVLSGEDYNALYIPEGFGHGFAALEDSVFVYKCTAHYAPQYEGGICWNDPELNIDWQIASPLISEKDRNLPTFAEFRDKIGIT